MSAPPSRAWRAAGRVLRMPGAALDRPGLRWMLRGLSPAPVLVLVHRGRRSGRLYKTPVEALVDDPGGVGVVVSPMFGTRSGWYRNVLAGGLVEVHRGSDARAMRWRQLSTEERREATSTYRSEYPLYSRVVLRMLVAIHRFEGDPEEAVVRELPMLALTPTGEG